MSGMERRLRRSASAAWMMLSNSLERWLISITDMPQPCQLNMSACACCSTSIGSMAGPAEKLKMRSLLAAAILEAEALGRWGAAMDGGEAKRAGRLLLLARRWWMARGRCDCCDATALCIQRLLLRREAGEKKDVTGCVLVGAARVG